MAKQFINIGIEGNDGTGDSNEMHQQIPMKILQNYMLSLTRWTDRFYNISDIQTLGSK